MELSRLACQMKTSMTLYVHSFSLPGLYERLDQSEHLSEYVPPAYDNNIILEIWIILYILQYFQGYKLRANSIPFGSTTLPL